MLNSPRDVVVGVSSLQATIAFLNMFGFEVGASAVLPTPAARLLYGLDGEAAETLLAVPGAELGRIRLIATPNPPRSFAAFDVRPFALDLFSTDVEGSRALAVEHGYEVSPITDHHLGPVVIRELAVTGPDQLKVTLLWQSAGRRPSILDRDFDRLHSEVHAFVWSDSDLDGTLELWRDLGLTTLLDFVLDSPGLGELVGVDDDALKMRMAVLADADARPVRVEFMEFLGKAATPSPTLPLAAGLHAPAFEVEDLDAFRNAGLPLHFSDVAELDTAVHPGVRGVTVATPRGHRFEVWARS